MASRALWCCMAAATAAVAAAAGSEGDDDAVRMLLVEVSEAGAEVVFARMVPDGSAVLQRQGAHYPPHHIHADTEKKEEEKDGEKPDAAHTAAPTVHTHVLFHPTAKTTSGPGLHMLSYPNVRRFRAHGWNFENETFSEGSESHPHAVVDFAVPAHVDTVTVDDTDLAMSFEVPVPSHVAVRRGAYSAHRRGATLGRGGEVQQGKSIENLDQSMDAAGVLRALPRSGPVGTQQNFVFLAGGYLASQREQFLKDLDHVVNILQQACGGGTCEGAMHLTNTVPFKRYFTTFNVFAVFEPSAQEGASIPKTKTVVNNNLDCSYGTQVHRALFCSPSKVIALADTAPCGALEKTNVVSIVLVNSKEYGGAASYRPTVRVGSFSVNEAVFNLNDAKQKGLFASLFFHEVGHCYSDLMDEYDTGMSESTVIVYPNCAASKSAALSQWSEWYSFDVNKIQPSDHRVYYQLDTPSQVCGWSNYWKASTACFMEKLSDNGEVPRLCPVCREKSVSQFYNTGMDISSPKCPLGEETLYVDNTRGVHIFINSVIALLSRQQDGGPMQVLWSCQPVGGTSNKALSPVNGEDGYVFISKTNFTNCGGTTTTGIKVTVQLSDQTLWMTTSGRATTNGKMEQSYSWTVMTAPDASAQAGVEKRNCFEGVLPAAVRPTSLAGSPTATFEYYSVCQPGKTCKAEYSTRQYNASIAEDSGVSLDDVKSLLIPWGLIAIGGLIAFLMIWWCCVKHFSFGKAKSVYETRYDKKVSILRRIIVFSGLFFLLVAVAAMVVGTFYFNEVGAFMRQVLIAGYMLAMLLFVMAFVGTVAAHFRAKVMLYVNSLGLFFSFAVMVYATHVTKYIADHITDGGCDATDTSTTNARDVALPPCAQDDTDVAICGIKGVGCELGELWKELVKSQPDKICDFQKELKCSGYKQPCNRGASFDYCPVRCDEANSLYGDACKVKLEDDIQSNAETLFPIMIALTFCMGLALFNNFALAVLLGRQHVAQRKKQKAALQVFTTNHRQGKVKWSPNLQAGSKNKAIRLLRALSPEQREKMKQRFQRADKNNDGSLDKKELRQFLRAVLCRDLTASDSDEVFNLNDQNKDGKLQYTEFEAMFDPESPAGGGGTRGGGGGGGGGVEMSPKDSGPPGSPLNLGKANAYNYTKFDEHSVPTPQKAYGSDNAAPLPPPQAQYVSCFFKYHIHTHTQHTNSQLRHRGGRGGGGPAPPPANPMSAGLMYA